MREAQLAANHQRLFSLLAAGSIGRPRIGIVSSYDPNSYAAKVRIQPDDVETGWLPITVLMAGQGWGAYFGPNNGDQCSVLFQENDSEVGFITGFFTSDSARPPVVNSGEMHFVHKAGWSVKLLADGIHSKGPWFHDGAFQATGDITDQTAGGNSATVKQLRDAYDAHKHTGVSTGAGVSGPTDHNV